MMKFSELMAARCRRPRFFAIAMALGAAAALAASAGATQGMSAQARAAVDRSPATRPGTAYVVNAGSGTVTPIATATNKAGPAIRAGTDPEKIAITPDGRTAYVMNSGSGTVTPITTATNKAGPTIGTGKTPFAIAITP
jgi:YVTN family beta-propeller protein